MHVFVRPRGSRRAGSARAPRAPRRARSTVPGRDALSSRRRGGSSSRRASRSRSGAGSREVDFASSSSRPLGRRPACPSRAAAGDRPRPARASGPESAPRARTSVGVRRRYRRLPTPAAARAALLEQWLERGGNPAGRSRAERFVAPRRRRVVGVAGLLRRAADPHLGEHGLTRSPRSTASRGHRDRAEAGADRVGVAARPPRARRPRRRARTRRCSGERAARLPARAGVAAARGAAAVIGAALRESTPTPELRRLRNEIYPRAVGEAFADRCAGSPAARRAGLLEGERRHRPCGDMGDPDGPLRPVDRAAGSALDALAVPLGGRRRSAVEARSRSGRRSSPPPQRRRDLGLALGERAPLARHLGEQAGHAARLADARRAVVRRACTRRSTLPPRSRRDVGGGVAVDRPSRMQRDALSLGIVPSTRSRSRFSTVSCGVGAGVRGLVRLVAPDILRQGREPDHVDADVRRRACCGAHGCEPCP